MDTMPRQWPVNQRLILSTSCTKGTTEDLKSKTVTRKPKVDHIKQPLQELAKLHVLEANR